jgi:TatD DNase family protein
VPNRGKTGEPGFVADTAQFVADLRGVSVGELSQRTAENFHTLFAKTRLVDTPAAAHRA